MPAEMPADFVERLARKWCAYCVPSRRQDPVHDHHYHEAIAAAIREIPTGLGEVKRERDALRADVHQSESKWIRFEKDTGKVPLTRKTPIYFVVNKTHNFLLGEVRWSSPWRQYAFFPQTNTVYAKTCLDDIARFIESLR